MEKNNTPKISYAVTCNDEYEELRRLYKVLQENKRPEDEIVIQQDSPDSMSSNENQQKVAHYCDQLEKDGYITNVWFKLDGDFASFKNNLSEVATGDYIFQIDADEYPSPELIQNLHTVLEMNPGVDLVWVPRINTVDGLTSQDVANWRWRVDGPDNRVNFPDYQSRIYRRDESIKWKNRVHERITGIQTFAKLPMEDEWCLHHPKTITKQRKQNEFYNTL